MITKILPVQLTSDEERSKGKEAAAIGRACSDMCIEMEFMKTTLKNKKDALAQKESEMAALLREVDSGQEYREVQCREEPDYKAGTVSLIRLDTGAVVETRTMTIDERQAPLPFVREV